MDFNGRCINFELWFVNEDEQVMEQIYRTLENLIKKDIDEAVRDSCDTIIGLLLYEGFLYKNDDDYYDLLRRVYDYGTAKGIKKFSLVCGVVWDYQVELQKRNLNYNIIEFDYSANAMWQSYRHEHLPNWNSNADRFLFLGGVPDRKNRITLLSKFHDADMLHREKAIWTFFAPTTDQQHSACRQLLAHYTDQQYNDFIKRAENSVDTKYLDSKEYTVASGKQWKQHKILDTEFLKDPNYISQSVFNNTSISVISEGYVFPPACDSRFLTEKTWRAVINRHPFVMADDSVRKNFARGRGLTLFDEFFIAEYNNNSELDGVVKNIQHLLNIRKTHNEQIQHGVDQNFRAFFNIINKNEQTMEYLRLRYRLSKEEIAYWFRQRSFDHLFRIPDAVHT